MINISKHGYGLVFLLLAACTSTDNEPKDEPPEFNVSSEQIRDLQIKFIDSSYDVLTLLMIDRKGEVISSKLITWNKKTTDEKTARRFSLQMRNALKFSEDNKRESEYLLMPYGFIIEREYDIN
ncbi:hypothetical protein [Colwellia echini]|uniref:TonB C-terminal domain-containing protein n=1 Tax=Colwellia echini TaxID=1982103 RepID=A0ABY3MT68_9GAMM|nr:hypothetical protein [Colwellia echini]TYK64395.1 hypothetical protein CWS31_015890 [Colwellia echini]